MVIAKTQEWQMVRCVAVGAAYSVHGSRRRVTKQVAAFLFVFSIDHVHRYDRVVNATTRVVSAAAIEVPSRLRPQICVRGFVDDTRGRKPNLALKTTEPYRNCGDLERRHELRGIGACGEHGEFCLNGPAINTHFNARASRLDMGNSRAFQDRTTKFSHRMTVQGRGKARVAVAAV